MGMTPVRIDARTEIHVKDNVVSDLGWHLWMALYIDGEYIAGDEGAIVDDLADATIEQAARDWYARRGDDAQEP